MFLRQVMRPVQPRALLSGTWHLHSTAPIFEEGVLQINLSGTPGDSFGAIFFFKSQLWGNIYGYESEAASSGTTTKGGSAGHSVGPSRTVVFRTRLKLAGHTVTGSLTLKLISELAIHGTYESGLGDRSATEAHAAVVAACAGAPNRVGGGRAAPIPHWTRFNGRKVSHEHGLHDPTIRLSDSPLVRVLQNIARRQVLEAAAAAALAERRSAAADRKRVGKTIPHATPSPTSASPTTVQQQQQQQQQQQDGDSAATSPGSATRLVQFRMQPEAQTVAVPSATSSSALGTPIATAATAAVAASPLVPSVDSLSGGQQQQTASAFRTVQSTPESTAVGAEEELSPELQQQRRQQQMRLLLLLQQQMIQQQQRIQARAEAGMCCVEACDHAARLGPCPECKRRGIQAVFCSQTCFQERHFDVVHGSQPTTSPEEAVVNGSVTTKEEPQEKHRRRPPPQQEQQQQPLHAQPEKQQQQLLEQKQQHQLQQHLQQQLQLHLREQQQQPQQQQQAQMSLQSTQPDSSASVAMDASACVSTGTAAAASASAAVTSVCDVDGCNKPATIGPCPTCLNERGTRLVFCSQNCFTDRHFARLHESSRRRLSRAQAARVRSAPQAQAPSQGVPMQPG